MPRKRRRSTWGSNDPAGPGRRRLRFLADTGDGRGLCRHSKTVYGTAREGDAELARLRVMYERQRTDGPMPTFGQCWEQWYLPELAERLEDGSIKPRTVDLYKTMWRVHLEPRWARCLMRSVEPSDYQAWLLTLTESSGRISDILAGNLVKCAKRHNARGIEFKDVSYRVSRRREAKTVDDTYDLAELGRRCRELAGTVCELPAILMAFGSCRVGEACAPLLSDVRSVEVGGMTLAVVTVNKQQMDRDNSIAPCKNKASERPVVVPEPWSLRVLEIAQQKRAQGLVWLNDNGCGELPTRDLVSRTWKKSFKTSEMKRLPMTKLRNSWETVSRWTIGIDKDKVDKMMGHTTPDIRSKHYDRPDETMFAETVAEAWNLYYSKIGKVP